MDTDDGLSPAGPWDSERIIYTFGAGLIGEESGKFQALNVGGKWEETGMELARPQLDVGLFTNKLEEAQAFYGEKLGLQFESILPVGAGFNQRRTSESLRCCCSSSAFTTPGTASPTNVFVNRRDPNSDRD